MVRTLPDGSDVVPCRRAGQRIAATVVVARKIQLDLIIVGDPRQVRRARKFS